MQDSGSLAVFKVTARDQGHYKGPLGAFVTYCNIFCLLFSLTESCGLKSSIFRTVAVHISGVPIFVVFTVVVIIIQL